MAPQSLEVPRFVQEHATNTLRIQDPSLAFFRLFSNYDIRYVLGCDIDGVFRPTESLNTALQFYINQIKPPLPQVFYEVPDILSSQVS